MMNFNQKKYFEYLPRELIQSALTSKTGIHPIQPLVGHPFCLLDDRAEEDEANLDGGGNPEVGGGVRDVRIKR